FTYVAEADGQIVGFSELERSGRIATLYVHHRYQTQGIASRLLSDMETRARVLGARRLTAEASLTAYGFFQRRGFKLVRPQDVSLSGVLRRTFIRERVLGHGRRARHRGDLLQAQGPGGMEGLVPPPSRHRQPEDGCRRPLRLAREPRAAPFGLHGVGAVPPRHPLL